MPKSDTPIAPVVGQVEEVEDFEIGGGRPSKDNPYIQNVETAAKTGKAYAITVLANDVKQTMELLRKAGREQVGVSVSVKELPLDDLHRKVAYKTRPLIQRPRKNKNGEEVSTEASSK